MNHPLNNSTSVGTYTPPAMYTPRPGADAHKRYTSLMTAGAALAAPVPSIAPTPAAVPAQMVQQPAPVVPPVYDGYLPKPGSVAHRLCILFLQHPGLSYTAADVAHWFASKKDLVPNLLARSIEAGLLQRKRDCAEVFYSAGPHIARIEITLMSTETKEAKVAITKQIPAKKAKPAAAEDHSTAYKPKTILADALKPEQSPEPAPELVPVRPVTAATGRKPAAYTNLDLLEICDDPLIGVRALPDLKYQAVFEKLKPGQCIKCAPADVGKISGGLRKYFERNNIKDQVKTTSSYETDGLGRVWWVATAKRAA